MSIYRVGVIAIVLHLSLAASGSTLASPAGAPYGQLTTTHLPAELPVTLAGGQILLDGIYVNEAGPFRFLLDTGAMGGGRVDASLVRKLGLAVTGETPAGDGTDRAPVQLPTYTLASLRCGPLTFRDVSVLSRDYNQYAAPIRGHIDGILGMGLFEELLLTIDYPGGALRLARGALPAANGKDILELLPDAGVPTIEVEIAGRRERAQLDTGAMGGLSVPQALAAELPLDGTPQVIGEARTLTGAFELQMAPLRGALRLGAHEIARPDVVIGGPLRTVNLGGRILHEFVLTFDQRNGRVQVERAASQRHPDAPERTAVGPDPIELPLHLERGRPVVSAMINGRGPYPLVIDTGAGPLVLAPALIRELELTADGTTRVGDPAAPDVIEAETFRIGELALGAARFENLRGLSWSNPLLESGLGDARGIIGLGTFADCLLTLDFPGQKLGLRRGALSPADGSVRFRWDGWIPTLDLEVGSLKLPAHLDTGNMGALTLPGRIASQVKFAVPPRVIGRARTFSGEFEIRGGTLADTVRVGGKSLENAEVHLTDRFDWANVGFRALQSYAITIDQTNQRIHLAAPDDAALALRPPEQQQRYGFMLAIMNDHEIEIRGTLPDSRAARAGLRAGDRIIQINGRGSESLKNSERDAALRSSPLTLTVRRGDEVLEVLLSWDR